jgi:hypothetical protein
MECTMKLDESGLDGYETRQWNTTYKQHNNKVANKGKRKLKSQPKLPRNQRLNLDPRPRRHLTQRQSVVGKYSLWTGVVVPARIDGSPISK